jgi:hypothetical protein
MLEDKPTFNIPNTNLIKPYGKSQSQDHLSFQTSYSHTYDGKFDYANEEINSDFVKPIYDTFLFVYDACKWSIQVDEYPYDFHDTCDESASEDFHEFDRDFKLYDIIVNPLFQLREVREFDTSKHIPPKCTCFFNEDDYFKDIPMFLNPCYESSLHHDNHVPYRKIPNDDNKLFDEFINHPFKVQTLNPKSNSIDIFIISGKASVGWHVLEIDDRYFWVLINHFSSP